MYYLLLFNIVLCWKEPLEKKATFTFCPFPFSFVLAHALIGTSPTSTFALLAPNPSSVTSQEQRFGKTRGTVLIQFQNGRIKAIVTITRFAAVGGQSEETGKTMFDHITTLFRAGDSDHCRVIYSVWRFNPIGKKKVREQVLCHIYEHMSRVC